MFRLAATEAKDKRLSVDEEEGTKKESQKDKKRLKKEKQKSHKEKKKAKKQAKKEKHKAKKDAKKETKGKKKACSVSSSSSSSSDSSSDGFNFVMDRDFGDSGKMLDPRNPDARIQRALGLGCGNFGFVEREDDEKLAKEAGHQKMQLAADEKLKEDQSKDWICQRSKADGEACGARNFLKNENCYKCNKLRPRTAPTVRQSKDKGTRLDYNKYK